MQINMIRTTISLPTDLHEELRLQAIREGVPFTELVVGQLKGETKRLDKLEVKKRLKQDWVLFDKVASLGKRIDAVQAVRGERNRDNA